MLKYVLRRFCSAVFSLFIIVTVMFCLLRMMPLEGYLGPNVDKMSPEVVAAKLAAKGLDKPVHVQLAKFYKDLLLHGDLGRSWIFLENVPVVDIIEPKIGVSLKMGGISMLVALAIVGTFVFGFFNTLRVSGSSLAAAFPGALGWLASIPTQLYQALPFIITAIVLIITSIRNKRGSSGLPAALGLNYYREDR